MEDIIEEPLRTVNVIVAGITGTGKSTLINAVFGKKLAETGSGRPVTEHMNEYYNEEVPIRIWDTVGLELDSEKTERSIRDIKERIAERSGLKDVYEAIHTIWYCINSGSNRYQGAEVDFIQELHSIGVPFIIVLTQCSGDEDAINEFADTVRKENEARGMKDIRIVQVLALPVKFRGMQITIEPFGLKELVEVTTKALPEFLQRGFIAAQQIDRQLKRAEGEKIIYKYVLEARKGKWKYIPIVNVFFTDGKISKMFKELAGMYNKTLAEDIAKSLSEYTVTFPQKFWGLICPIDIRYSKEVARALEEKKNDGFKVPMGEAKENCRTARMVAFFGYTFIDEVEARWDKIIDVKKEEISDIVKDIMESLSDKVDKATKCEK